MNILITGGTGFIGQTLCPYLLAKDHHLWVLTRNIDHAKTVLKNQDIHFINRLDDLGTIDAVINLAGAPISKYWSDDYKKELIQSRVELTRRLVDWCEKLPKPPAVMINGSAIGFYGSQGDNEITESSRPEPGFSHELCRQWEQAAAPIQTLGVRLCYIRTGIVLGAGGGALQRMRLPFLLGLGGPIASGQQWMSWIHIHDLARIIEFCLEAELFSGAINATAPQPVKNEDFAAIYAKVLRRPAFLRMPAFILRFIFGQMAEELLLNGQRVIPSKLIEQGFIFDYPSLLPALSSIEQS